MKEILRETSTIISLAAAVLTFWEKITPLFNQTEAAYLVSEAVVIAGLVGVLAGIGWKLWIRFCRWIREHVVSMYGKTKTGRFIALQDEIESLLSEYPWPSEEHMYSELDTRETHQIFLIREKLKSLGIPAPRIGYYNVREYFEPVFSYIVRKDLKGCIKMSQEYKEQQDQKLSDPEEEYVDPYRWHNR